jgi:hypothetical protein
MSCFRLRFYSPSPPGTYFYEFTFKGQKRTLGPFPIIEDLATALSDFRTKNGLRRASKLESLVDCDRFQCLRLGGMPQFCVPCDSSESVVAMAPTAPLIAPPCAGCGVKVTA